MPTYRVMGRSGPLGRRLSLEDATALARVSGGEVEEEPPTDYTPAEIFLTKLDRLFVHDDRTANMLDAVADEYLTEFYDEKISAEEYAKKMKGLIADVDELLEPYEGRDA